jgi:hypothetical protein
MSSAGYQPSQDEALVRMLARAGLTPDDSGRVLAAVSEHPGMLRDFLAAFADLADPEERWLAFALTLTALRVRQGACDPPEPAWPLALLMAVRTAPPEPERAADGRPADDLTPALPVLLARTTLTAAPPCSPAPVLAGAPA